jgi:alanine racemase
MRTWIEIDRQKIRENYETFRNITRPETLLMAVVKSNAYGHNLTEFSLEMEKLGIDWLAVDSIIEAESLRSVGIKKPILVLGYTSSEKIDVALKNNISLTVSGVEALKKIDSLKSSSKKDLKIHLKIDTGMHRQGFFLEELYQIADILRKNSSWLKVEGVYTHLASAKNPQSTSLAELQIKKFRRAVDILRSLGFEGLIKHCMATSGTILFPRAHFDMVRVGIGMYGLWPSKEIQNMFSSKISLKPVLSFKTIIGQIKQIRKNSFVGYEFTEQVLRDTKIAIIPVGYWHGLPFALSNKGKVIIHNKKAKILGRISMDMICVDVTEIEEAQSGSIVTVIGKEEKEEITAKEIADYAQTTHYEIITRLNPRMQRRFF